MNIKVITIVILVGLVLYAFTCNKIKLITPPKVSNVKTVISKDGVNSQIERKFYTEEEMKLLTDSLKKSLKAKEVTATATTITVYKDSFIKVPVYIDTISGKIYTTDSNKYRVLTYIGNYRTKTGNFNLSFTQDTVTYTSLSTKKFLQREKYYLNINHTNELFKTSEGNSIEVKPKKTVLVFGPSVGIDIVTLKPTVGFSVTYNLISLKRK